MRIAAALTAMLLLSLAGMSRAKGLELRERVLMAFIRDVSGLALEMQYRPRELGLMIKALETGELGGFWRRLRQSLSRAEEAAQAWREAVDRFGGFNVLSAGERAAVLRCGDGLGAQGAAKQLMQAERTVRECERLLELLRTERAQKGALYTRLGLLMGAAAALLIL